MVGVSLGVSWTNTLVYLSRSCMACSGGAQRYSPPQLIAVSCFVRFRWGGDVRIRPFFFLIYVVLIIYGVFGVVFSRRLMDNS